VTVEIIEQFETSTMSATRTIPRSSAVRPLVAVVYVVASSGALRRQALVSLANPMLGYALYGIAQYLWNGVAETAVPSLSIAGVRYLPLLRYRLAPYGVEWSLINELGGRIRPMQIELRVGRSPQAEPWGISIRQRELVTWPRWGMHAGVDVWRQPRFSERADTVAAPETRVGVQLRGRASRPLIPVWFSCARPTIIVDVSFKTAGFVPGEPLDGGIVARAGVGLPLGFYAIDLCSRVALRRTGPCAVWRAPGGTRE
jgi:hypothetical protein